MGLFNRKEKETILYEFEVAGTYYNQPVLLELYKGDESYDARVARELTNKHDPNALKVSVGLRKIGYIHKYDQERFKQLKNKQQVFVVLEKDWDDKIKATLYIRANK